MVRAPKDAVTFGLTCIIKSTKTGYIYYGDGHYCKVYCLDEKDQEHTEVQLKSRPWSMAFA